MNQYKLMTLNKVLSLEAEAERLKVSKVARGPNGFLTYYKSTKGKLEDPFWIKKRNGFIARHLAQFIKNPTYRRLLALNIWAYDPTIKNKQFKEILG